MADDLLHRLPGVRIDADNEAYYRGLLERQLLLNRCGDCRAWHHPPRSVCPRCWSRQVAAEPVAGHGTIALATFLHQGPRGVDYAGGRPVAAVELDEQAGLRVTGGVVDSPRERIVVGARVELVWVDRDGVPAAAFRVVAP
jgi:hypothetical protein